MKFATIAAVLLAVLCTIPLLWVGYKYSQPVVEERPSIASVEFPIERKQITMQPGAQFQMRGCNVIDGYRFEMSLDNGQTIEAHLPVATKAEAIPIVVDCLKKASSPPPVVKLLRNTGTFWIVDFELTVDNNRSSIIEMLRSRDLLLN